MNLAPFKKRLAELAFFYGQGASDQQIEVWAKYLAKHLSITELGRAIGMYCDNPENTWFPKPVSKLVALLKAPLKPREEADLIASRINEAVIKFGYMGGAKALEYIGPIGQKVVRSYGGWRVLCEMHGSEINAATVRAHMRDHAVAEITLERSGVADYWPDQQIEHNAENKELNSMVLKLAQEKGMGE